MTLLAAHVQELIDGFWPIHVLTALAKLELPEALADGSATTGELARRLGLDEFALFRLLRAAPRPDRRASMGAQRRRGPCQVTGDAARSACRRQETAPAIAVIYFN